MDSEKEEVNFGKSLLVPSVQQLAKEAITKIPPRYVHADQDSPVLSAALSGSVPVIDLHSLLAADSMPSQLQRLHSACKEWGFFQVINHGVPDSLLDGFRRETICFFDLDIEEKKKLWQHPDNQEGFGQLFVVSEEQKLDWSDMFFITTLPKSLRRMELFEKIPPKLRDIVETYSAEMKKLAVILLGEMAKALKMSDVEMKELFKDGVQTMRMNYYPPCPEPDVAMGFTPHSDADALTILFQLNETEGLEIRKDGRWVKIKPLQNAFVVNVGDIMEIVSNGVYQSVEHRATVNSKEDRLSVATFYSCNVECEIGPAQSLIGPHNPAVFRRMPVKDYFKDFFNRKLSGKSYLDYMKIENEGH